MIKDQITIGNQVFDAVFERTLDFQIELEFAAACQFIQRIYEYNEFQAHRVLEALWKVDKIIPRMQYGEGNPNNGARDYKISVGREGSPVIYIKRFEVSTQTPMTEEQAKEVCSVMEKEGLADEATYTIDDKGPYGRWIEFRFWWD